jgi:hypothetical protein
MKCRTIKRFTPAMVVAAYLTPGPISAVHLLYTLLTVLGLLLISVIAAPTASLSS